MSDLLTSINSAIVSGTQGLKSASDGITLASLSIAQQTASTKNTSELLADVSLQQLGMVGRMLPTGGDTLTQDLVSLSINSINAMASAKVVDTADETVGTLIDEIA